MGHLSQKSTSGEDDQSQDDRVTKARRRWPASVHARAKLCGFGFRTSAGLLFDTQSVRDHRRAGVQQPEASSVLGTAPKLRRTSTTSVTPDAAVKVRIPSVLAHERAARCVEMQEVRH